VAGNSPAAYPTAKLFGPEMLLDPYPAYRWLREQHPIYWYEERGGWLISRYQHIEAGLKHPSPPFGHGTTYYYVVTAITALGETTKSAVSCGPVTAYGTDCRRTRAARHAGGHRFKSCSAH
jgi:cytochrome P450